SKPASRAPRSVQISTPVGPPPTTTKVSHARRESISSSSSEFSKAPIPLALHERVGEGLHARRPLGKLILTEVTLPDACCDHQAVVRESCPPPIRTDDGYRLLDEVDIDHVAELHLRVHMLPQHFPRRRRDRAGWEDAGRDLVEQRLEEVVVRSVDECDLDRGALEEPRCEQAAEPCANDHDPVAC